MITTTEFDASKFNLTAIQGTLISSDPLYAYYGNLKQGLPFAAGVTNNLSYATFELSENAPANAALTAEVDAMVPDYNCTVLKPTYEYSFGFSDYYQYINLSLPRGIICQQWQGFLIPFQDPRIYSHPPRQLTGDWEAFTGCDGTNAEDSALGSNVAIYYFTDISYHQTPVSNQSAQGDSFTDVSWELNKLVVVACIPSYEIVRLTVTNDTTTSLGPTLSTSTSAPGRSLPGFDAWDMSNMYNDLILTVQDTMTISTLLTLSQGSTDVGLFSDAGTLRAAAQTIFKGIISQWIDMNLKTQTTHSITGSVTYTMNRLQVNSISLWAMVVDFALLMLATLVLMFTAPANVTSRQPNTIGAMSAILTRSKGFIDLLSSAHAHSDATLEKQLSGHSYRTVISLQEEWAVFRISVFSHLAEERPPAKNQKFQIPSWLLSGLKLFKSRKSTPHPESGIQLNETTGLTPRWRPFTLSVAIIIITFAIPISIIVVLEVLQRLSDRHQGIVGVAQGSEKYIRYIPALTMLLVAMLFSSLDFNVSTFASYSKLLTGNATSKSTILANFVGKLPPHSLFEAARGRQFGVFASTTAAIIGSVLTIVVSGLYSVQDITSRPATRTLSRLDTFDLNWTNSSANDNTAGTILSLIEHLNLSYPKLTYSEVALPAFSLGEWVNPLGSGSTTKGLSTAVVPALRANLRCTIIPKSNISVWTNPSANLNQEYVPSAFVNATFSLPADCQLGGDDGHSSIATITNQFGVRDKGAAYAGAQIDLNYGPGMDGITFPGPVHPDASTADNPPGCPSLAFTFGYFDLQVTDKINVTTMVCFQEMQEVKTQITLQLNSTELDSTYPPIADESSVKTLQNAKSGGTTFQYRIQNHFLDNLVPFPDAGFEAKGYAAITLDVFFQAILGGKEKIAPELLVGPENEQRLSGAINHFYRRYMAQAINANMRKGCTGPRGRCSGDGQSSTTKRADVADSNTGLSELTVGVVTRRLQQNAAPKLALQIMLGVMTACGLFAFWFTRMRNTLPYNPWSIAGTMGLLAGSELCRSHEAANEIDHGTASSVDFHRGDEHDLIPLGAEWMSDREVRRVFSKYRYSLGWWRRSDGSKRYGIDVGIPTATTPGGVFSEPKQKEEGQRVWKRFIPRARKGYRKSPTSG